MPYHKTTQKEQAKLLYFTTEKTQKEIAEYVGITRQTVCAWVKKDNWAQQKRNTYYSPEQELNQLYEELREINTIINGRDDGERFANKTELETKSKILALISGPLKNTADKWRNVAPDMETSAEEQKACSAKIGRQFSAAELRKYYEKVAYWYVMADMGAKKDAGEPISVGGPGYEHILHSEAKQKKREEEEKMKKKNFTQYRSIFKKNE